jgi:hypothetical protein
MSFMTLTVVDNPPDRPEWMTETIRLVTGVTADGRRSLLHLVEETTDADLLGGTPDDWGLGQIAVHLLIVDRGVSLIALRLARGEDAGSTGQRARRRAAFRGTGSVRSRRRPPRRPSASGRSSRPDRIPPEPPFTRSTGR